MKKILQHLLEQEANAYAELENRNGPRKQLSKIIRLAKEKKELESAIGLSVKQKADLEALRELAFNDRKAADAMRVTEAEYKYGLIQSKIICAEKTVR